MKVCRDETVEAMETTQSSDDQSCSVCDIRTVGGESNGYMIGAHG